ncbi:hypothetical protein KHA80_06835 [Anaerobacillus sp. HL2]|nr:hypothetical protein KHA80_06835 [Anaerobacillus sp. HL2]
MEPVFGKALDGNHDSDYKRTERQRRSSKPINELKTSFTESFSNCYIR